MKVLSSKGAPRDQLEYPILSYPILYPEPEQRPK